MPNFVFQKSITEEDLVDLIKMSVNAVISGEYDRDDIGVLIEVDDENRIGVDLDIKPLHGKEDAFIFTDFSVFTTGKIDKKYRNTPFSTIPIKSYTDGKENTNLFSANIALAFVVNIMTHIAHSNKNLKLSERLAISILYVSEGAYEITIQNIQEDKGEYTMKHNFRNEDTRALDTIQIVEKLNTVFSVDAEGPGGAHHMYTVVSNTTEEPIATIQFQCGPRKDPDSLNGIIDSDLLEMVRDRLTSFQNGPFSSEYNEKALASVEDALKWLNKRVEDRIAREVLGENKK